MPGNGHPARRKAGREFCRKRESGQEQACVHTRETWRTGSIIMSSAAVFWESMGDIYHRNRQLRARSRYSVVGAGAIGGTLAWHLAQAGHHVTLIETDAAHVGRIVEPGLVIERDG